MTTLSGKCLCGTVRFRATIVETHYHACHCGMCRRWSGGPLFATPVDDVTFEGSDSMHRYQSSEWAERGFCNRCGSSLFYFLVSAKRYMMMVGSFDDSSQFRLDRELFVDQKSPGYAFAGDHPRWTEEETLAHFSGG